MLAKLRTLRADYLKINYNLVFYDYQEEISDRILAALIQNFRLTANSTPADIDKLKQHELAAEISRQAGKTLCVGHTAAFIMTFFPEIFNRPVRIGIFAPQLDQAKLSYDILRTSMRQAKDMLLMTREQEQFVKEQESARKLVLPNGSSVAVAPINVISQIEGLALDLIIIDEAQSADDNIVQHSIFPMGKTTNAPRVYIGKAGTQICHFYRLSQRNDTYKVYFSDVAQQRRQLYEQTGNVMHLIYEKSVKEDIQRYGEDSDYIQREFYGKWQIGTGQFTTQEEYDRLITDRRTTKRYTAGYCFAGIDTAKHPDSTVVTVLRFNKDIGKKEVINWIELRGDNYQDQFDIITNFLGYFNIVALAIDSTGMGDFMPDLFEKHTNWRDENSGLYRVKFTMVNKDIIYKNLKVTIKELLTTLPKPDKYGDRLRQQMLDLQQEWKGQLLSVNHPDAPNAHDDYPDSWALAEYAYAKYNQNLIDASIINVEEQPERKVSRDDTGKVTDYWPNTTW